MARLRAPAAALATALLLAPALAADEGPVWMTSLKKAAEKSKDRGAPILVWCVGDVDTAEKADQATLLNKDVQKAMAGYLVVFANPKDTHGTVDGTLDGKPAKVCKLVPALACSDHIRCWNEVYKSYGDVLADKQGTAKVPNHFVAGPDGKVIGTINSGNLASGFDAVAPGAMVKGLKDLLAKAGGPGLTDAEFDGLQKTLAAARTLVEGGRMKEAAKALRPFTEIRKAIAIVLDARELLKKVDREALVELGRAKGLLKDKPLAGLAALDGVAENYPGTESADAAAKAAAEFRESPEGKKAVKELAREKEGRAELQKALDLADAGRDDARALRALDAVAKKYDGLPCGDDAEAKAAAIRGDAGRMAAVAKADAERAAMSALTTARGLLDGGKKEEAAAKLKEIVAKYPDSAAAREAAKLLEGLR